jgi:hypothetical protein
MDEISALTRMLEELRSLKGDRKFSDVDRRAKVCAVVSRLRTIGGELAASVQ